LPLNVHVCNVQPLVNEVRATYVPTVSALYWAGCKATSGCATFGYTTAHTPEQPAQTVIDEKLAGSGKSLVRLRIPTADEMMRDAMDRIFRKHHP
jgi:hypothetical protein